MKDIKKTMTQEQIDTTLEFILKWLKNQKPYTTNNDCTSISIVDGDFSYSAHLSIFDPHRLSTLFVSNNKLDVRIMVSIDNNNSISDEIENFIKSLQLQMGVGEDLSNSDFLNITNLTVDQSLLRERKIKRIKDNIE